MSFENGDETVYSTYPTFETPNLTILHPHQVVHRSFCLLGSLLCQTGVNSQGQRQC